MLLGWWLALQWGLILAPTGALVGALLGGIGIAQGDKGNQGFLAGVFLGVVYTLLDWPENVYTIPLNLVAPMALAASIGGGVGAIVGHYSDTRELAIRYLEKMEFWRKLQALPKQLLDQLPEDISGYPETPENKTEGGIRGAIAGAERGAFGAACVGMFCGLFAGFRG